MADKPIIALPRGEYDARSLVLADQEIGWEWDDISGATTPLQPTGGNATYQAVGGVGTPWSDALPAVRMDNQPANDQWGANANLGQVGNAFTLFVVAEATDLVGSGMAFWGSLDGTVIPTGPLGIYLYIKQDGAVGLVIGAPFVTLLQSAPGLVSAGDRVIITARRIDTPQNPGNTSGPAVLRVNGVEVSSSSLSGWNNSNPSRRVGVCNLQSNLGFPGLIEGDDGLYAHLIAYGSAASDQEILDMEAFLQEVWFPGPWVPSNEPAGSVWTPTTLQDIPAGPKPLIASPRGEWDARTLVLADQQEVLTWPDSSPGGSNDLVDDGGFSTYEAAGGAGAWSALLPGVRMNLLGGPGPDNFTIPSGWGGSGTPMTMFHVLEVTDNTNGCALIGTSDGINPIVGVYTFIEDDGTVWFSLGRNGGSTGSDTRSAPGVVSSGDRIILTVRREEFPNNPGVSAGPTIIRVNGVEVASDLASGWVDFWFQPQLGQCNLPGTGIYPAAIGGDDRLIAHVLAFQSAASDEEILQMEAYLAGVWGFNLGRVPTEWVPS